MRRIVLSIALAAASLFGVLHAASWAGGALGRSVAGPYVAAVGSDTITGHAPGGSPVPWTVGARVIRRYTQCVTFRGHRECDTCTVYEKHGHRRTICTYDGW